MPKTAPQSPADKRLFAEVRIALAAARGSPTRLAEEVERGRASGLTGAEIKANFVGKSFDARAHEAIRFALACCDVYSPNKPQEFDSAKRAGLKEIDLAAISALAIEFTIIAPASKPNDGDRT